METNDTNQPIAPNRKPGVCISWEDKRRELAEIKGDAQLVQKIWEDVDALGSDHLISAAILVAAGIIEWYHVWGIVTR